MTAPAAARSRPMSSRSRLPQDPVRLLAGIDRAIQNWMSELLRLRARPISPAVAAIKSETLAALDALGRLSFSKVGFSEIPKSSAATQSDPSCQPIMIERELAARSIRERPMIALHQQADHFGPTSRLAPGRFGNERQVGHERPSPCAGLHSLLARCRPLHITLDMIVVECGRVSCDISMPIAEADFGK